MTTYNTGNPIGSTDARDRLDNTENMDYLENSTTELTHPDRLGNLRRTRHGMEVEHDAQIAAHEAEHDAQIAAHEAEHDAQIAAHEAEHDAQISAHEAEHDAQISAHEAEHDAQMQAFESDFDGRLAGMAFTRAGTFAAGYTLTNMRQTLEYDGHEYSWAGTFPKVVAAGATPAASGGIGAGAWVDRTDMVLRGEITPSVTEALRRSYAEAGYTLVSGSFETGGILSSDTDVLLHNVTAKVYAWTGAFPHVAAPGTDPTLPGSGYVPRTDVLLRSNTEPGSGALMRVDGPAILDAERYALERASGGRQTIIRDAAGASNVMFVLPRFTYDDLGLVGGIVSAFDFGSGSIKSEIFIGAYLASGSGAVSAPMQDPRVWVTHTDARNACTAKGAGWHLMTAHEDAAIALWCMVNGYEPIGNTNYGSSHAKTWLIGSRADGKSPGDTSGVGSTKTGSMGPEANHDKSTHGIADLVGNVWEWRDGFLLQDGRFKVSTHNTQAETSWSFIDAYLDASPTTGGGLILSNQIINRLGAIGDNSDAGNLAAMTWRAMPKSSGYVSNDLMRSLLLEPSQARPQGAIYMRNYGERFPFRGGGWIDGINAGLAAVHLNTSRGFMSETLGFRTAFAS